MSNAAPCTGSNIAKFSPMLAAGASPILPVTCAASSEIISPNKFVVKIVSNLLGYLISSIEQASTYISSNSILGYFLETSLVVSINNLSLNLRTFDL